MSTEQFLLAAVKANPDDNLPRLVMADWLEENGQPERGEFIRVQCELAKVLPADVESDLLAGGEQRHLDQIDGLLADAERWGLVVRSLRRLNELGSANEWWGWRAGGCRVIPRRGFPAEVRADLTALVGGECTSCGGDGRVERVVDRICGYERTETDICLPCHGEGVVGGWLKRLVRTHPIERVRVSDREPFCAGGDMFHWYDGDERDGEIHPASDLPGEVFADLKGGGLSQEDLRWYATPEEANAALSDALLKWAMSERTEAK